VIHAIPQVEFGFRPATRAQLSGWEEPWRGHQFGAIPGGLVAELSADPADGGITEGTVEAAFTPAATAGHVLGRQLLNRDHVVGDHQIAGDPVDFMSPDGRHPRVDAPDPGVGALPPLRRLPSGLGGWIVGPTPARGSTLGSPQP
jgi:hypothetical protein